MDRLEFNDYEEFLCAVIDKLDEITDEDEFNDIAIIAKYEEARQIIKELLCMGCDIKSVNIHDAEWDGYDDEYIVSVTSIDDEYEVWCEPFLRESGYITDDSKVTYILDNCSSKVMSHCEGETVYEVNVGDESDCDDECCCDCRNKDVNNKPVSTTSKETYKVNGKRVDKETYEKELAKFEDRYMDNIRDMLLRYAEWMDCCNELLKLVY